MGHDHTCSCGHAQEADTEKHTCCGGGTCNCAPPQPNAFDHVNRIIQSVSNALNR